MRGNDLEELYPARGGIHLDDRRLRRIGVGREVAVFHALLLRALEVSYGEALRRAEVVFRVLALARLRRIFFQLLLQKAACFVYRAAIAERLALGHALAGRDRDIRIPDDDIDVLHIHAQRFRRDLHHGGAEALSHVRAGDDHVELAVAVERQPARAVVNENALADAGVFESGRHAPAEDLRPVRVLALIFLERVFDRLFAQVDRVVHAHAALEELSAHGVAARIHSVAPPQLKGVDAELFGHFIERRFNGDGRLVDAVAAERAAEQVVVARAARIHADVRDDVRPAGHQTAGHQRAVALCLIGAAVGEHVAVKILELSVFGEADLIIGVVPVAAGRDENVLLPRERDLHGLTAAERRDCHWCFKKGIALLAEAAAERRRHDADVLLVHGEIFGEHRPDLKGRLRAGVHRDPAVLRIPDGGDGFHADMVLRLDVLRYAHLYDLRIGFTFFHVAGLPPCCNDIAVVPAALGDAEARGKLRIIDLHELCRGPGMLGRIRHDHSDMIADKIHLIGAVDGPVLTPRTHCVEPRYVRRGDNAHNAGRGLRRGIIHGVDACVRRGGENERAVEHRILAERIGLVIVAVFECSGSLGKAVHVPDALPDEPSLDLRNGLSLAGDDLGRVVHLHGGKRHILAAQPRRGELHALDDLHIAGAAAVVVLQPFVYILLRRGRGFAQQRLRRHDHARRAEAALHRARVEERALDDLQHCVVREIFDRLDALSGERFEKRHARARKFSVYQHAARAAVPGGAAFLAALHALDIAQIPQKRHAPFVFRRDLSAVQNKCYTFHSSHLFLHRNMGYSLCRIICFLGNKLLSVLYMDRQICQASLLTGAAVTDKI